MYSTTWSDDNLISLQPKVFFEVSLHFRRIEREGLRELKKEQFIFKEDSPGTTYATHSFYALVKNHQGFLRKDS